MPAQPDACSRKTEAPPQRAHQMPRGWRAGCDDPNKRILRSSISVEVGRTRCRRRGGQCGARTLCVLIFLGPCVSLTKHGGRTWKSIAAEITLMLSRKKIIFSEAEPTTPMKTPLSHLKRSVTKTNFPDVSTPSSNLLRACEQGEKGVECGGGIREALSGSAGIIAPIVPDGKAVELRHAEFSLHQSSAPRAVNGSLSDPGLLCTNAADDALLKST
eukprot:41318-Rhodomonas_salina.1